MVAELRRPLASLAVVIAAGSCNVTPLTNKLAPGEEPLVIGVAEGADRQTDLFAASAGGGPFYRVTFSRPAELLPAISPLGTSVAFARARSAADTASWDVVVLDLLTAGERRAPLPGTAAPRAIGWSAPGDRIYVRADTLYAGAGPPAALTLAPVDPAERARADSATQPMLGDPPFAVIAACPAGMCVISVGNDTTTFPADVQGAFRWGGDSVALVRSTGVEVRPLGGGRTRVPRWTDLPAGFRAPTYHPGSPGTAGRPGAGPASGPPLEGDPPPPAR